jgi:DNA-binding transcriptional regulator YiaG
MSALRIGKIEHVKGVGMPDVAAVLREEIRRLARKEIREQIAPLKKSMTELRKRLSDAQREIGTLQKTVRTLEAEEARRLTTAPKPEPESRIRFSPKWVAADRARLGLSADDYGRLVGVSGQTIYAWERGTSKPRKERLAAWAAVRGIGKRAARQRLELLDRTQQKTAKKDE